MILHESSRTSVALGARCAIACAMLCLDAWNSAASLRCSKSHVRAPPALLYPTLSADQPGLQVRKSSSHIMLVVQKQDY